MIPAFFLIGMWLGVKGHECETAGRDPFWWIQGIVLIAIVLVIREAV